VRRRLDRRNNLTYHHHHCTVLGFMQKPIYHLLPNKEEEEALCLLLLPSPAGMEVKDGGVVLKEFTSLELSWLLVGAAISL